MRSALALPLLAGCSLYFGHDASTGIPDAAISDTATDLHQLTVDRTVPADTAIRGVDSDQAGMLWLVSATEGNYAQGENPIVTVAHWDPVARTSQQVFTYDDLASPVSGLALVQGELWLNYEDVAYGDQCIRVIDPGSGAVVRTVATTGLDVAGMGSDALVSTSAGVDVLDAATGGFVSSFTSPTVIDPSEMGGISFAGTEEGVAWRPGEIWVADWLAPMEVFDDTGADLLGTVDLAAVLTDSAAPRRYIKFDRGQLLVGFGSQLTWYDVQ